MKASELRIGNLVYLPSKAIYSVDFLYKNYEMLNVWEPIPITEEWLLKFSFKNNELVCNHLIFIWFGDHVGIKGMLGLIKPWSCVYVHQLQNLYFALTGEELIYKKL
jgi:hypothetical protein